MFTKKSDKAAKLYTYSIQFSSGAQKTITCAGIKEVGSMLLFRDELMGVILAVPLAQIVYLEAL